MDEENKGREQERERATCGDKMYTDSYSELNTNTTVWWVLASTHIKLRTEEPCKNRAWSIISINCE